MQKRTVRSSKSSTGCQRCKYRHAKCDETKPQCNACVAAGEPCPGYTRPLRWSRKHELLNKPANSRANVRQSITSTSRERNASPGDNEGLPDAPIGTDDPQAHLHDTQSSSRPLVGQVSGPDVRDETSTNSTLENAAVGSALEPPPTSPQWMQFGTSHFGESTYHSGSVSRLDSFEGPSQTCSYLYTPTGLISPWLLPLDLNDPLLPQHQERPNSRTSNTSSEGNRSQQSSRKLHGLPGKEPPPPGSTRSLLHTFYRLSLPKSVPGFADDEFVNYYFKHVTRLLSCVDSSANPFLTMVAACWTSNRTVNLAIQSIAIAHLSNWYPYMAAVGLHKRKLAWRSLQHDLKHTGSDEPHSSDEEMLSLLLLGLSSSWHINSNLGSQFLAIARNLTQYRLQYSAADTSQKQLFFDEALIYWEMLMSFVDPVPMTTFSGHGMPDLLAMPFASPVKPHPWTGVSTELHYAFAEVGRLLRRHRSTSAPLYATDPLETQWAQKLEDYITSIGLPTEDQIADYDDPTTPKQDLIACALAHKNVILMEICGIFPALLRARLTTGAESHGLASPLVFDADLTFEQKQDTWFITVATQTVQLLQQVRITSAACRLQPILLLSIAGQFRFPAENYASEASRVEMEDDDASEPGHNVDQNRWFVEARMLALSRKFPQKHLLKMMDIIKEVWTRLDSSEGRDTHWMDVINEKGWYTIMG